VEGDKRLFNPYHVMLVSPARHPHVKAAEAQIFADWLVSDEGQKAIADFKIDGQQLFFPNAKAGRPERIRFEQATGRMYQGAEFELKVLDPRLHEWGLPAYHSDMAAGIDLRACVDAPIHIEPQGPAIMVSSGIAILINRPDIAAFVLPRSGLGARHGIILGQCVGTIDPDYAGPGSCPSSTATRRNPGRHRQSRRPHSAGRVPADPPPALPRRGGILA
jgi:hypothetical protein